MFQRCVIFETVCWWTHKLTKFEVVTAPTVPRPISRINWDYSIILSDDNSVTGKKGPERERERERERKKERKRERESDAEKDGKFHSLIA